MKKKIAILGSTGSIGKTLLNIVYKDKENFEIILLTANKDYKTLFKQAKKFNVKNLIITNNTSYKLIKKKNSKINIYNSFDSFNKIFKKKVDYVMSAIVGLEGLKPTINVIKFTKKIAIANKESIICGWNLITKELNKNKTKFIPVDSEHFSLWYGLHNLKNFKIEKIYLTASGGPFYKLPLKKFINIKLKKALKHPNWKMGKKISIDSATMINKVYEVIEAKNIFNIPYKNIKILVHPNSYIHAIIKFNNGMIKLIAHDTTMKIPIYNTLYLNQKKNNTKKIFSNEININKLNNLNFKKVDLKRYPMIRLLDELPEKNSLYETIIVSANDNLVDNFIKKKIKFTDINKILLKISKIKEFTKYKKKVAKNIEDINKLADYVRLKISTLSV